MYQRYSDPKDIVYPEAPDFAFDMPEHDASRQKYLSQLRSRFWGLVTCFDQSNTA